MTTEASRELPPLPEPAWLKMPDGESFDDDTATKWAWFAHGYDTGMEPFFSADQMRAYAEAASAGRSELLEALKELAGVMDAAGLLNLANGVQLGQTVWYVKATDAMNLARSLIAKHTKE